MPRGRKRGAPPPTAWSKCTRAMTQTGQQWRDTLAQTENPPEGASKTGSLPRRGKQKKDNVQASEVSGSLPHPPSADSPKAGTSGLLEGEGGTAENQGLEQSFNQKLDKLQETLTKMAGAMEQQQKQINDLKKNQGTTRQENGEEQIDIEKLLGEQGEVIRNVDELERFSGDTAGQSRSRQLILAGMPLGCSVPENIRKKVQNDEFVDLAKLLYPQENSSSQQLGNLVLGNANGVQSIMINQKSKQITNIEEWKQAFDIFISIYTQGSRSGETADLLTYASDVQNLAKNGYDWAHYDLAFRTDRAARTPRPSWSALNQHLYNAVICRGKLTFRPKATIQNGSQIPSGYCFSFHTAGRRCYKNPCTYKHACYLCRGNFIHPAYRCRQSENSSQHQESYPGGQQFSGFGSHKKFSNYSRSQYTGSDSHRNKPRHERNFAHSY